MHLNGLKFAKEVIVTIKIMSYITFIIYHSSSSIILHHHHHRRRRHHRHQDVKVAHTIQFSYLAQMWLGNHQTDRCTVGG